MQLRSAKVVQDLKTGYVTFDFGARARGTFISALETVPTQSTCNRTEFKCVFSDSDKQLPSGILTPLAIPGCLFLIKKLYISICSFKKVIPKI